MDNLTVIAQVTKTELDGTITDSYTIAAAPVEEYFVPTDPMDELQCDSCQ